MVMKLKKHLHWSKVNIIIQQVSDIYHSDEIHKILMKVKINNMFLVHS